MTSKVRRTFAGLLLLLASTCYCDSAVVSGNWSEWGAWHNCSASCGTGNSTRYRTCTNPSSEIGGTHCNGTAQESNLCDTNVTCPSVVTGNWSEWGAWHNCSASCGTGNITRYRTCTNPSSEIGGTHCNGTAQESNTCDTNVTCPVNGGWTDWGNWSSCTLSCGTEGERVRSHSCTNPPPSNGGLNCSGDSTETSDCDPATQPPCCTWTAWVSWSACTGSPCSGGIRLRSRNRVGDQNQCSSLQGNFIESELCIAGCTTNT